MDLLIIFLVASLITALAVPLTIKFAKTFHLVDDPKKRPHPAHVQTRVIPRAGGLAIYIGLITSILLFLPIEKHIVGIILGITLLLVVGLFDDLITNFNPYTRLGLLFLAAALAVGSGIGISFITNPLYGSSFNFIDTNVIRLDQIVFPINFLGEHKLILIADLFAFLWIITLTQILNWSKGVDGQMPGITFIAALTLGFLSLKFYYQGDPNQLNLAKLSFIMAGASLGFLIFNWYPSKILPAFSGSTISAFMLAVLSILSGAKVATALLVLAIPAADFVYTFFRRILQGSSPVWGDRGHLHHRLLNIGWSHQKISLFYILGSAMLGAIVLLVDSESKLFIALIVAVSFFGFILWLNSFGALSKPPDPDNG